MTKPNPKLIAGDLKKLKASYKPVGPSGLPAPATNSDDTMEGTYRTENLSDPGYIGGVTGTGGGRIMGG